jgi:hemerythrin superfamily protein
LSGFAAGGARVVQGNDEEETSMDAVTAITNDHRALEALFDKVQQGTGDRTALLTEIKARLTAHNTAEEQRVYPAIKRAEPDEADEVDHGIEEHREGAEKLEAVESANTDEEFTSAFEEFVSAVKHHVEEEESEVLPALKEAVSGQQLDELGAAFEEARLAALSEHGIDDTATKQDLYEQAAEQDIPGRSGMNKDELKDALRDAGGTSG